MQIVEHTIIQLLRQHDINVTRNRIQLLSLIYSIRGIITTGTVLEACCFAFDRITIYRTLHAFYRKGLLELVPNTNGKVVFSLPVRNSNENIKRTPEVNAVCTTCGSERTILIPGLTGIGAVSGFHPNQIIVKGFCENCII